MSVLERSELEASPLADLHAIAGEVGLDGFRRLRKAELIDAILGEPSPAKSDSAAEDEEVEERAPRSRARRAPRSRRASAPAAEEEPAEEAAEEPVSETASARRSRRGGGRSARGERERERVEETPDADDASGRIATGVVEVLGNGSAFLRVDPPEPSDEDVYISAAQVRRCELVSGDNVSGPVRTPRRSERYPSLVRIDTINGASADAVADGARYEDLSVAWPSERLALGGGDTALEAIEWLTPIGRGSRAVIVGARQSGKSETLRRLLGALSAVEDLEVSLVLIGVRPEEIADLQDSDSAPAVALSFAASADSQTQALERALDAARRTAARGGHALVLIDTLDGISQHAARRALAAARKLQGGGSLTVIATASAPIGGETTVIALDRALSSASGSPVVDLAGSGTLRADLLVGEDGAKEIAKARAAAIEAAA